MIIALTDQDSEQATVFIICGIQYRPFRVTFQNFVRRLQRQTGLCICTMVTADTVLLKDRCDRCGISNPVSIPEDSGIRLQQQGRNCKKNTAGHGGGSTMNHRTDSTKRATCNLPGPFRPPGQWSGNLREIRRQTVPEQAILRHGPAMTAVKQPLRAENRRECSDRKLCREILDDSDLRGK